MQLNFTEKAEALLEFVAYPDWIFNRTLLDSQYPDFQPSTVHIQNIRALLTLISRDMVSLIDEPVDRNTWITSPSTVNAFYDPSVNSITFPAGILQPPFFSANNLKALNYGGIGSVIGHEITHAFDDEGRQNDKEGNLVDWWSNTSISAYHKKADCIRKQYFQYCSKDVHKELEMSGSLCVNGNNTLSENIADNGGLKIALNAYRAWVERNGGKEEERLPGLTQFSPEQLFFIGFAQSWCGKATAFGTYNSIKYDSHSPGNFRVIGCVSNSEDFSNAFKCSTNATMNPAKKCEFW